MENMDTFKFTNNNIEKVIYYSDILYATMWHNSYGNPSYGVYLKNGEKIILVDNYEFARSKVNIIPVSRKKYL